MFTGAVGMWLAPVGTLTPVKVIFTLLGTVLVVAAANALNMYLERDVDALMLRTADRPLPAGRLHPSVGLGFGLGLALFSLPILSQAVNPTTALLGFLALVIYVGAYTPLKQKTWLAVVVGAVPGAIPPLMGWTAATGHLGAPGVALFAIMFLGIFRTRWLLRSSATPSTGAPASTPRSAASPSRAGRRWVGRPCWWRRRSRPGGSAWSARPTWRRPACSVWAGWCWRCAWRASAAR